MSGSLNPDFPKETQQMEGSFSRTKLPLICSIQSLKFLGQFGIRLYSDGSLQAEPGQTRVCVIFRSVCFCSAGTFTTTNIRMASLRTTNIWSSKSNIIIQIIVQACVCSWLHLLWHILVIFFFFFCFFFSFYY